SRGLHTIDPTVDVTRASTGLLDGLRKSTNASHLSFGRHNDIWAGSFIGLERYDRTTRNPLPVFADGFANDGEWTDPFVTFVYPLSNTEQLIGSGNGLFRATLNRTGAITHLVRLF